MNTIISTLKQDIYSIIEKSLYYPSGDNSQPFNLIFTKQNSLRISCTKLSDVDPFGVTATYVSLGCFLEIISLQAQNIGYKLAYEVPDKLFEQVKFIEIHFKKDVESLPPPSADLIESINKRFTDRRAYLTTNVADKIKEIATDEKNQEQTKPYKFSFVNKLSSELTANICKLERKIWSDYDFTGIILRAVNYQIIPSIKTTGLNLKNIGIHPLFGFLGILERDYRWAFNLNVLLGRTWLNNFIIKRQLTNSGGFGLVSIQDKTPGGLVAIARIFCRTWIKICGQGYSFQPMSASTLLPLAMNISKRINSLDPDFKSLLQETNALLKNEFQVSREAELFWLFRVGLPKSAFAESARTGRKPMSEVWSEE